ncbi:UDP-N-acetylmuramoyl-tripeptide--D-alanyl-D-alanine ligase [Paenibacillus massiliensis]|uniref:UDP-N-acetylmuramoyl-tripeptide--D-alanyl-D- alanine ligase n=1 Tax=Paenibacillus massiliensis TaxID=225917 RepID=UPI0004706D0D|nr:UDP-N-acetylmuramoyl-tripeptide--D-alanyl-D-alanine ligase [Paenibacillus massiliensis]
MIRTIKEVADMCGGTVVEGCAADALVRGVFTDSRTPVEGALFVPLQGENFDGHTFGEQCLQAGAAALLWQKGHPNMPTGPVILVDDTLKALQQLASAYLKSTPVAVVGITGSNGKTTTKDMIEALLSTKYKVHKTQGNLNNHIGLPLTILQMPEDTDIAILEMGMSGRGEIRLLSELAQPDVAVITNIGEAHLLQLGSREEIARAKLEIIAGLKPGGLLVMDGDEPLLPQVLKEANTEHPENLQLYTFGRSENNDDYPTAITTQERGILFTAHSMGQEKLQLPLLGHHNVLNTLAAIGVARHFTLGLPEIRQGLSSLKLTGMRIEILTSDTGLMVLNDAYNASPSSMKAAIDTLAGYTRQGRKIAVLGDMLELGPQEEDYHAQLGRYAADAGVAKLFAFGRLGAFIAQGALEMMDTADVAAYTDKDVLINHLLQELQPEDIVLVKASRGMKLEIVVNALINAPLQN